MSKDWDKIAAELNALEGIDPLVYIGSDDVDEHGVVLDGRFTAANCRAIADALDGVTPQERIGQLEAAMASLTWFAGRMKQHAIGDLVEWADDVPATWRFIYTPGPLRIDGMVWHDGRPGWYERNMYVPCGIEPGWIYEVSFSPDDVGYYDPPLRYYGYERGRMLVHERWLKPIPKGDDNGSVAREEAGRVGGGDPGSNEARRDPAQGLAGRDGPAAQEPVRRAEQGDRPGAGV